jgi:CRP/FNR family transcriptional regulator, cyclic AMP receptor protein
MLARGGFFHRSDFPPAGVSYPNPGLPPKKPCHSVRSNAYQVRPPAAKGLSKRSQATPDPLFLFHCGSRWHHAADTASGWELVQAMRSTDPALRALAAELLAETENGRLLVRDLRRTRSGLQKLIRYREPVTQQLARVEAEPMNTPYGLDMVENCITCKLRKEGWYCSLPEDLLKAFSGYSHLTTYPGGAILFVAGQMPRGAFVLCSGKVKLSTTSKEGKVLVLRMVEPGEIIGLSAMISGEAYEVTAETVGPCLINLAEREGLLRLMERSGELGLRSALAVSREFQSAYRDINDFVLVRSSSGKLARLLLSWIGSNAEPAEDGRIQTPATHEEMAQRIGASRETVTRLLSELRKKDWIRLEGSTLVIKNRQALQQMAM